MLKKIKSYKANYVGTMFCGNLLFSWKVSKKKKKIVRIYFCRRGYFSRANFYKFCFASAKARKSHPAKISFKVAQVYQRKTCFIWKRTVFRKSHLFVESRYNKSHLWWPQIHRAKRVWKTYNFIIWWDQNKIRVRV